MAAWLRTLDDASMIAPQAVKGIGRTATLLEKLAATATVVETGHRIVHTSTAPIIDQLPDGDVSHLLVYAPFHDEKGAAVRRLIERLRARRATLAVQSDGRTVIQPEAPSRRNVQTNHADPTTMVSFLATFAWTGHL